MLRKDTLYPLIAIFFVSAAFIGLAYAPGTQNQGSSWGVEALNGNFTNLYVNDVLRIAQTGAATFSTVDTGQGAYELYGMDQNVLTSSAVTFTTVDTGQGANELYDMNQNVLTTSSPSFVNLTLTGPFLNGYNITDIMGYPQQPASYIVWTDGTNIFAKNGTDGSTQFSGTNAATVINNAINTIGTNGGKIFLKVGYYNLTTSLDMSGNKYITLEGEVHTNLWNRGVTLVKGYNGDIIEKTEAPTSQDYIVLRNLLLDGDKTKFTGRGIDFVGVKRVYLYDIRITSTKAEGVRLSNCEVGWVYNLEVADSDDVALSASSSALRVYGAELATSLRGFYASSVNNLVLSGVNSYLHSTYGIWLDGTNSATLIGVRAWSNTWNGIYIKNAERIQVSSSAVFDNSLAGNNVYSGLKLENSENCTIIGLESYYGVEQTAKKQKYAIEETGTSNYNILIGNIARTEDHGSTPTIIVVGANTRTRDNIGYTTENDGTTTLSTTFVNITHGLSFTPSAGDITLSYGAGGTYNCTSVGISYYGATYFTVRGYDSAGVNKKPSSAITINWRATRD